MTHIIRFPAPTIPYPGRSAELETAEYVLLTAIRLWVDDHRRGVDPLPRLSEALSVAGVQDAAFAIDQLMAIVARTARQPVAIHCPLCAGLSADETCLLHAASLAQAGEDNWRNTLCGPPFSRATRRSVRSVRCRGWRSCLTRLGCCCAGG